MHTNPMTVRRSTLAPVKAVLERLSEPGATEPPPPPTAGPPVALPAGAGRNWPAAGPVAEIRPRGTEPDGRMIVPFGAVIVPLGVTTEPLGTPGGATSMKYIVTLEVPPL